MLQSAYSRAAVLEASSQDCFICRFRGCCCSAQENCADDLIGNYSIISH
jgi:hypothetical protein